MRAFAIASFTVFSFALALGAAGGCSSGSSGGGAVACSDGGVCPGTMVCGPTGFCVQPGTGGGSGSGGSGGGTATCSAACTKGSQANCPNFSMSQCEGECADQLTNTPASCTSALQAYLSCIATNATFQCDADGEPQPVGCEAPLQAYITCMSSGTGGTGGGTGGTGGGTGGTGGGFGGTGGGFGGTGGVGGTGGGTGGTGGTPLPNVTPVCTGPTTPPSAGSCYTGLGTCNPVTNSGCTTAGAACDLGQSGFQCFDPPNDTACAGSCNNQSGPFCMPGNSCVGSSLTQCARYCCTDADCGGATGSCVDLSASMGTTFKVCGSLN